MQLCQPTGNQSIWGGGGTYFPAPDPHLLKTPQTHGMLHLPGKQMLELNGSIQLQMVQFSRGCHPITWSSGYMFLKGTWNSHHNEATQVLICSVLGWETSTESNACCFEFHHGGKVWYQCNQIKIRSHVSPLFPRAYRKVSWLVQWFTQCRLPWIPKEDSHWPRRRTKAQSAADERRRSDLAYVVTKTKAGITVCAVW